jgi:hypothetical protein
MIIMAVLLQEFRRVYNYAILINCDFIPTNQGGIHFSSMSINYSHYSYLTEFIND